MQGNEQRFHDEIYKHGYQHSYPQRQEFGKLCGDLENPMRTNTHLKNNLP
jgi:hypothetical protein